MRNNNGKIAIAIVAMFVVALSVVGFTYAYFTATVKGNSATESVKVTAGELSIVYGEGKTLTAQNLVPGWTSDGKHYYDVQHSSKDNGKKDAQGNPIYEISATNTTANPKKSDNTTPGVADGIADKVPFTVSNATNNDGDNNYIIRLKDIKNGVVGDDAKYLWVTLYETTISGETTTYNAIWSGNLANAGTQIIVPEVRTITKDGAKQTYAVGLTYQNVTDREQTSKGVGVSATVEVVGVQKNQAQKWVDADGHEVKFAVANTTDYATKLETTKAGN